MPGIWNLNAMQLFPDAFYLSGLFYVGLYSCKLSVFNVIFGEAKLLRREWKERNKE